MRARLWTVVHNHDLLAAHQLGCGRALSDGVVHDILLLLAVTETAVGVES